MLEYKCPACDEKHYSAAYKDVRCQECGRTIPKELSEPAGYATSIDRKKPKVCPTCKGDGEVFDEAKSFKAWEPRTKTCPDCHGSGAVDETWGWTWEELAEAEADRKYHAMKDEGLI